MMEITQTGRARAAFLLRPCPIYPTINCSPYSYACFCFLL